jgi:hypothetical protein
LCRRWCAASPLQTGGPGWRSYRWTSPRAGPACRPASEASPTCSVGSSSSIQRISESVHVWSNSRVVRESFRVLTCLRVFTARVRERASACALLSRNILRRRLDWQSLRSPHPRRRRVDSDHGFGRPIPSSPRPAISSQLEAIQALSCSPRGPGRQNLPSFAQHLTPALVERDIYPQVRPWAGPRGPRRALAVRAAASGGSEGSTTLACAVFSSTFLRQGKRGSSSACET